MAKIMDVQNAVNIAEFLIENPSDSLSVIVFLFVARITPMINVDSLIKNEQNQTLLTWKDDSNNKKARNIGYVPAYTSLEGISQELVGILKLHSLPSHSGQKIEIELC